MKFRTKPEAEKAGKLVGQPVEWVKRNYGAQRELTWNIRLTDGTEIHNWSQVMPDRTLSQATKELEQLSNEITSLEAQIQAKRAKMTEVAREQAAMVSETLSHFGMRLVLENAKDSLPVVSRRGRPKTSTTLSTEDKRRNAAARLWGKETNWTDKNGKPVSDKGPMPIGLLEDYNQFLMTQQPH